MSDDSCPSCRSDVTCADWRVCPNARGMDGWIDPEEAQRERRRLKDGVWLTVAQTIAKLSTCPRRSVGCVLVDVQGFVLGTGYNGVPMGVPHCTETPCPGAGLPSGTGLDTCEAIHAETNALLQCRNVQAIHTVYCTDSPCVNCVKAILNTSALRICFVREYPAPASKAMWLRSRPDREWVQTGAIER